MDEAQVLALLQTALADAGVTDLNVIRKSALELAVAHLAPGAPVNPATLAERVRQAWGLDYTAILAKAATDYEGTDLSASDVLRLLVAEQ